MPSASRFIARIASRVLRVVVRGVLEWNATTVQLDRTTALRAPATAAAPADPDKFDFGSEMHATRVTVDEMLAAGLVDEAEQYMEARRQLFVENGYRLRVLNQAYFAFHGSYATGVAATDPIGPKLERLRELSPSLKDFMHLVSGLTSAVELDQVLAQQEALHAGTPQP